MIIKFVYGVQNASLLIFAKEYRTKWMKRLFEKWKRVHPSFNIDSSTRKLNEYEKDEWRMSRSF